MPVINSNYFGYNKLTKILQKGERYEKVIINFDSVCYDTYSL
jgi:hypothetical protein